MLHWIHRSPSYRWTNKDISDWLTDAICHKHTLIQIYKCKCTTSWHRMSNRTSGKQLWESKIFLSIGITEVPSVLGLMDTLVLQKPREQNCASSAGVRITTELNHHGEFYDLSFSRKPTFIACALTYWVAVQRICIRLETSLTILWVWDIVQSDFRENEDA